MGFWGGVKRFAEGKPVFETPVDQGQDVASTPAGKEGPALVDSRGQKIIPELVLEHCRSRIDGQEMEITAWVTNRSAVEIELDKVVMLGMTTELDRVLSPGEAREVRLYEGKVLTEDSYDTVNLYYKQRINGDYFQADFRIEYDYDSDGGFYIVEDLHPNYPVRDV